MKILITGGAGFIGSHLAQHHLQQKDAVWVVDNLSTGRLENLQPILDHPYFRFTKADLNSWEALEQAAAWADGIYHMAAIVGQKVVIKRPVSVITENILGCERVLKAVALNKPSCRVVVASSSEVYGIDGTSTFAEDAVIHFPSGKCVQVNYSLSKFVNEAMLLSYVQEQGVNGTIARLFNTAGPNQTGRYGMVIPRFIEQAIANQPITVYGSGAQTRSFCDIRDTCSLLQMLMRNPNARGEIFNVGNDREISIMALALLIKERAHSSSEIVTLAYEEAYGIPFQDTLRRRPDLTKVRKRFSFEPKWSLEETIDDIIHQQQRVGV